VTPASEPSDGAATPRRSRFSRRVLWHTLGLVLAAALIALLLQGYRQPGFILDVGNFGLC
jgi:hypothetical protein